jgi:methyltransferase FkbM-like protein
VETIRLDHFVVQNNIKKIALMKIDVEGHEYAVLQGAKQTLMTLRPLLIVEIEQRHHDDIDADDIVDFVRECGYTACYFCWKTFTLEKLSKLTNLAQENGLGESKQYVNNLIFIPDYMNFKDVCLRISEKIKAGIKIE